jgi:hypothetical protein
VYPHLLHGNFFPAADELDDATDDGAVECLLDETAVWLVVRLSDDTVVWLVVRLSDKTAEWLLVAIFLPGHCDAMWLERFPALSKRPRHPSHTNGLDGS